MDKNTYYKELNLEYNIDKLLEEEKRVEYIQRWPDWQPNWSQGYVIDFSNFTKGLNVKFNDFVFNDSVDNNGSLKGKFK